MAHIVFVTYGITSYLNASYAVAAGLRSRGHQVTYVSSLDVKTAVDAQGFDFILLEDESCLRQNPERQWLEQLPSLQRYKERSALIKMGHKLRSYYLENDEWTEMMHRLQPDVLLIDEELPEIIIRATSLNVPMRLVQYFGGTRWRPGLPPLSSHLVPDGRLRTRFQIEVVWLALWVKRCLTHLLAPLFYAGTDRRSIIQAIAAQTGFDYSLAEFHHWFPMTFPNIPTLTLAAPEFDFAPMTTTGEEYVGPMVWTDRVDAMDSLTAAELEAFLIQNKEQKRPLIYCSLGTFWQMDLDFLQRVVAAFQQRPEWDLVLASGPGMEMDHFAPLPDNVVVYKRVPQLTVLEQADVVLTHGGIGTINECITFGVPMVVYSTGKLDQNGNAARILFHNLGLRGKIDETPSSISTKIAEILEKPRFRANVERMQTIYGRYQTDNRAVELIESLLP